MIVPVLVSECHLEGGACIETIQHSLTIVEAEPATAIHSIQALIVFVLWSHLPSLRATAPLHTNKSCLGNI